MIKKQEYIRPIAVAVTLDSSSMLAASGLKYSDKEADMDLEVLSNKRGGVFENTAPWNDSESFW